MAYKGKNNSNIESRFSSLVLAGALLLTYAPLCWAQDTSNPVDQVNQPAESSEYTSLCKQGEAKNAAGDYEAAEPLLKEAIMLNNNGNRAHEDLADTYKKLLRWSDAESEYKTLIDLNQNSTFYPIKLCYVYWTTGKFQDALPLYRDILSKEPNNLDAQIGYAYCLQGDNNYPEATNLFNKIIAEHPGTQQARLSSERLKLIRQAQGAETNPDDAREHALGSIDGDNRTTKHGWWNLKQMPLHVYIDTGYDGKTTTEGYRPEMQMLAKQALSRWQAASQGKIKFVFDASDAAKEGQWKKLWSDANVRRNFFLQPTTIPSDPVPAAIHVHWTDKPLCADEDSVPRHGVSTKSPLGLNCLINYPKIDKAHVWITTNRLADGTMLPRRSGINAFVLADQQDKLLTIVLLHEIGHALGLTHSPDPNDIMFPQVYGANPYDISQTHLLSLNDVQALRAHYHNFQMDNLSARLQKSDHRRRKHKVICTKAVTVDAQMPLLDGDNNKTPPQEPQHIFQGIGRPDDPTPAKTEGQKPPDLPQPPDPQGEEKPPQGEGKPPAGENNGSDTAAGDSDKDAGDKSADEKSDEDKDKDANADSDNGNTAAAPIKHSGAPAKFDPLKSAIFELNTKNYSKCLSTVNALLAANPNYAQAHYIKGIVYVMLRQYYNAAAEYREVINLSPNSDLSKRAQLGLNKIIGAK